MGLLLIVAVVVGIVAGILTILGAVFAAVRWVRGHFLRADSEPVDEQPATARPRTGEGPTQVSMYPNRIAPGGRVEIVPLGWIPLGDFESLRCDVRSPSGQTWTTDMYQDLAYGRLGFHFPDAFRGASSDEVGTYVASFARIPLDKDTVDWAPTQGVFRVDPELDAE